ncbi:MAG: polysaccharide biosynthesis/export family protein, partial [Armatimonadota bacterium]
TGAVASPGAIDFVSGLTVLKAIARAGGLKPNAAQTALLSTARSKAVTLNIDLRALMEGKPEDDIELQPGDYLQINEATVTVTGEVTKQGDVPYRDADTVLRAVANAGGITSRGDARSISVRRNGKEIAKIDLLSRGASEHGPDFRLEPGDTVFVPEAVVHVAGEVAKPGTYPLKEADTALKAVASAGGPSLVANTYRVIVQRGGQTVAVVNLNRVGTSGKTEDGTFGADYALQPGDVLFAPPVTTKVYVGGAVGKPGEVKIIEKERDKALDVLALAGGALTDADLRNVELRRPSSDGRYIAMRLDLSPSGTPAHNVILRDGDYLYVPVRRAKDPTRALVAASYVVSLISMIRTF